MRSRERQERDVTRALDCLSKGALVACAGPGLPSGLDLSAFRDIATQPPWIFVVDVVDVIHAEGTDLSARYKPTATSWTLGTSKSWTWWCSYRPSGSRRGCWLLLVHCFVLFKREIIWVDDSAILVASADGGSYRLAAILREHGHCDDFRALVSLTVIAVPGARLKAPLDVDAAALL